MNNCYRVNAIRVAILLSLCLLTGRAQTPAKPLPKGWDWNKVETEFYQQLNALRLEKQLSALEKDPILRKAAMDQAAYMQSVKQVTHDQEVAGKETPYKRVVFYSGTHEGLGENCIEALLQLPVAVKYAKTPIIITDEKSLATYLLLGWKNSAPHYKNMTTASYDVAGLGFAYDPATGKVYYAQVFAQKPYIAPKGLVSPADSYGVKDRNESVCKCMESPEWRELAMEIVLVEGKDSIYLKSEKLQKLKKFFNEAGDGLYLDFVMRDQFVCEKNNLLHGSPVYDGYMTKPVLFKDLFRNNKAKDGLNLFAAVGPVPAAVKHFQYTVNSGIIKKGYGCEYVWGASVPAQNLEVLHLVPKWLDNPDLQIRPDTFQGVLHFDVPFERGKILVSDALKQEIKNRLSIYKPFLKTIKIRTFSSVEGSKELNLQLQTKRAEEINKIIVPLALGTTAGKEIESEENWEGFFREIEHTPFHYLRDLEPAAIKQRLQSKTLLDSMEVILRSTRVARLEVSIETTIDDHSDPYVLLGAYQKALEKGDSLQAFACQSRLIQQLRQYKLKNSDITTIPIPENKRFLAHLTNWVGLATNDPDLFYRRETREKVKRCLELDTNFLPLQFNYCIMALKYMQELQDTVIPVAKLEAKMQKCYQLGTHLDSTYIDYMVLNYQILTAYRYYERYEYHKVDKPLSAIRSYFTRHQLSESEALRLGLLFNFYGRTSWTLSMLQPLLKVYDYNDDILFLFIKTYTPSRGNTMQAAAYKELLKAARKRDTSRFNDWIDKECFQLLRLPEIKEVYCTKK